MDSGETVEERWKRIARDQLIETTKRMGYRVALQINDPEAKPKASRWCEVTFPDGASDVCLGAFVFKRNEDATMFRLRFPSSVIWSQEELPEPFHDPVRDFASKVEKLVSRSWTDEEVAEYERVYGKIEVIVPI